MEEDNRLIEQLFRELYRSLRRESGVILAESGLTNSDFHYLRSIANKGGAQASEIAQEMGVRRGYVSALNNRMEKLRLVRRSSIKTDGRGVLLSLTPEGEKCFRSMESRVRIVLAARIARLEPSESTVLLVILQKLMRNEDQENPDGET